MKLLRIGVIILVIGVTLQFATRMRGKTLYGSIGMGCPRPLGPFLFEPRETTLVLTEVSPENETVTVSVVNVKSWRATQNISKAVFTASGMRELYSATFKINKRGLYYVVVTTSTGELADEVDMVVEQRGLAEDLFLSSIIISIIGAIIIATDRLKSFIHRKPKEKA